MRVTPRHLYTVPNFRGGTGYCARESRAWFAERGLSWANFVEHGIEAAELIATGDALALRVVEHAHALAEAEAEPQDALSQDGDSSYG